MKLSIRICATKSYLHVWRTLLRRVVTAAAHRDSVHIVFVSTEHEDCTKAFKLLCDLAPKHWQTEHRIAGEEPASGDEKYKDKIQQLIARMHGMGFEASRAAGADQCWTVEPDVLPPPDALRMMEWALAMPQADGSPYYDVAFCTYPNGHFIGGFGTPQSPINQDFTYGERVIPADLQKRYQKMKREEKTLNKTKKPPEQAWIDAAKRLNEEILKCPVRGNIWNANATKWRRRGWLDHAYPAIGRGAIVPVDWCGEGCNLLSKKALSLAFYDGYTGAGTQDLHLCWRQWHPNGLRIACITHTVCDHVKHDNGKLIHHRAYHETEGEYKGHLRVQQQEWVDLAN